MPGKGDLTELRPRRPHARRCSRLERYFDLPYPYDKLDLVAVPDFEAGAMENAGAVFFRETLLLVDPETATLQEKKRVAEVVCHELAHMWYGDLVTMAWWDDLWLNEAFATWMAFQVVDAWRPSGRCGTTSSTTARPPSGWTPWRTPTPSTRDGAYTAGSHRELRPDHLREGRSVVRMLERYLGAETFRSGVRRYIREHSESNTVAADLWHALSEASKQNVESIVRPWIEQAGFPLLRLRRGTSSGETVLRYDQTRFRLDGSAAGEQRWPIPWVGRVGTGGRRSRTERRLLTASRGSIPSAPSRPRPCTATRTKAASSAPCTKTPRSRPWPDPSTPSRRSSAWGSWATNGP